MIAPRFAANRDWRYTGHSCLDRVDAAQADAFSAVELQPHLHDIEALAARLTGLRVVLINAPAAD